jgi:hypothetical protein
MHGSRHVEPFTRRAFDRQVRVQIRSDQLADQRLSVVGGQLQIDWNALL